MSTGKKIYEITDTATSFAADDYLPIAGETNGTRKALAAPVVGAIAAAAVAPTYLASAAAEFTRRITLAGNLVLTSADRQVQRIIPDADRDVTLPAEVSGVPWRFSDLSNAAADGSGFDLLLDTNGKLGKNSTGPVFDLLPSCFGRNSSLFSLHYLPAFADSFANIPVPRNPFHLGLRW
jgi:hypothetical protein